jgi:hypothetical protein
LRKKKIALEYIINQFDYEYFTLNDVTSVYFSRTIENDFCVNLWVSVMMKSGKNCQIFGEKQILKDINECELYVDGEGFFTEDDEKLDRDIYVYRLDQR